MEKMRTLYFTEYVRNGSAREIEEACGSDYSGGIVQKSNFDAMCKMINEKFPNTEAFIELEGMHYTYGIGVFEDKLTDEELEWLEEIEGSLSDYPVLDEEDVSKQEYEVLSEHYIENVEFELERYFSERLNEEDVVVDDLDDDKLSGLFQFIMSSGYAITETGSVPYIDWDRAFKELDQDALYSVLIKEKV